MDAGQRVIRVFDSLQARLLVLFLFSLDDDRRPFPTGWRGTSPLSRG